MPSSHATTDMLFFLTDRKLGAIRPDGTGECFPPLKGYMEYVFPDGRYAVFHTQDPPKNPKADYDHPDGLGHARTHLWLYDFAAKSTREIQTPSLMRMIGLVANPAGQQRLLISGNINHVTCLFTCDLDGSNREDIFTGPGFAYGTSLSPDGNKAAFHITGTPGRPGYEIYVIDLATKVRTLIASDPDLLQFGPLWSPDGQWLLYQLCLHRQDPGHDRSDVCISRFDASEHRLLTTGQSHWFATSYGLPGRHGSGSNMPIWSPDGRVTCALLLPDSRSAWPYAVGRPDTDHFNRDYQPDQARGGTQICLIDINTRQLTPLTHDNPPTWNFRLAWSPDGNQLAFIRADTGHTSELWIMNKDGSNRRLLTRGINDANVDHPRWARLAVAAL